MKASNRQEVAPGVWKYDEESEGCLAVEVWSSEGIDLPSLDAFLEVGPLPDGAVSGGRFVRVDHQGRVLDERDTRSSLLEERRAASRAYADGNFDLSMAILRGIRRACETAGLERAATSTVQQQKEAAHKKQLLIDKLKKRR